MALVTIEYEGAVAIVTLNRPEAMNALSKALREDLATAMLAVEADDAVRAVVLTGAGERAFTAGLDLKELGADTSNLGAANATDARDNPVLAIDLCTKPVIGAINGVAITGGFEVALACDVLIASTNARFADTHARVGILPGWGLSQNCPGPSAFTAPNNYRSPAIFWTHRRRNDGVWSILSWNQKSCCRARWRWRRIWRASIQ